MARRWSPVCSPSPEIARRSFGWRRSEASVDGDDDLAGERRRERVREMRNKEEMREGEKREAGVVGGRPETDFSPAAMAARQGRSRAAWRRRG